METCILMEKRPRRKSSNSRLSPLNRPPANPFHPGEILHKEFLEPSATTQLAFAKRIGWTPARLNDFIKGRRGVTAEAALDLAETLGTSAKLWMNLQATYDLAKAATRRKRAA